MDDKYDKGCRKYTIPYRVQTAPELEDAGFQCVSRQLLNYWLNMDKATHGHLHISGWLRSQGKTPDERSSRWECSYIGDLEPKGRLLFCFEKESSLKPF